MKFLEVLVNAASPVVEAVIEDQIGQLLEGLAKKNPEVHKSTVQGLAIGLRHLNEVTEQTKTKIDDAAVAGLLAAVESSAQAHGIELPY